MISRDGTALEIPEAVSKALLREFASEHGYIQMFGIFFYSAAAMAPTTGAAARIPVYMVFPTSHIPLIAPATSAPVVILLPMPSQNPALR